MRVVFMILFMFAFVSPVLAAEDYICPMHPHIHGQKGDTCPICGMPLVPAVQEQTGGDDTGDVEEGALHIDPVFRQALGVRTAPAAMHDFGRVIHAYGHVMPSTRLEYAVSARTDGWIVDLKADAVGDEIRRGQTIYTFYSPDLMTAQSDYLVGRKYGSRIGDPEQKLHLFGMDDSAIKALRNAGEVLKETPFRAPESGTVTTLTARKGAYVKAGDVLFTMQDYSTLWVRAHLPLRDLQYLSVGSAATVTIDETGESFAAEVDYIHPESDPQSRNAMVRLVVDNPDGRLKTDTLVSVTFEAETETRLAVPEESVLYGRGGARVIEALGDGYFHPRKVRTGVTARGMTEILEGLEAGQNVVTSAQFMIDAESTLSGGMAAMGHAGHGGGDGGDMKMDETEMKPAKDAAHDHEH